MASRRQASCSQFNLSDEMMTATSPETLKSCCASAYESEFARILLGDSFHPGGLDLTRRLGTLLDLRTGLRVLDVASGKGDSAIFLAKEFNCEVVGIEFSHRNVEEARVRATEAGVGHLTRFIQGDAEHTNLADGSFDRVICECAFCTFPDKLAAAREMSRVLHRDGRIGISDLIRRGSLPTDLTGLISWISCIAEALPVSEYSAVLEAASFHVNTVEAHDNCLVQMAKDVQSRLLGLELLVGLKKLELPGVDLTGAKQFARSAMKAIQDGIFGYALILASRSLGQEVSR
jgi:arsenite methyltransferase